MELVEKYPENKELFMYDKVAFFELKICNSVIQNFKGTFTPFYPILFSLFIVNYLNQFLLQFSRNGGTVSPVFIF